MKIAAKTKDCRLSVTVKTSSLETINERELDRFARVYMRCFLKPKLVKRDTIEYTGPVAVSLQERMKKPVSKRDFLFILEYIIVAAQKLQTHNFPLNNLRMNMQQIYINETTKELQFLYLPVAGVSDNGNLVDLLHAVVYSARSVQEGDTGYIARFRYFLDSISVFNLNEIEQFIHREDRTVVNTIKKNNAGQSGFMTSSPQRYHDYMDAQKAQMEAEAADSFEEEDPTGLLMEDDDFTGLLYEEEPVCSLANEQANEYFAEPEDAFVYSYADEDATGILIEPEEEPVYSYEDEDATGILIEPEEIVPDLPIIEESTGILDDEGTCLLEETLQPRLQPKPVMVFPELRRILTGETIKVNKPVFRIGKERSYVDYFVTNNNAVSRSHADIITRGSSYFVVDLNSKNRTYINNAVLAVQVETEIRDGDILRLGNEEFEFRTRSTQAALLVCPNCKARVKQTSKFCSSCGCRL